jgi:methionyl-tRNA formyltransferase
VPQDLSRGGYFGGRRPEDGVIDWNRDATSIHNLVRAVAPPYPGAFTAVGGVPARILRTRVADAAAPRAPQPVLESDRMRAIARCGGGGVLDVLSLEVDGEIVAPSALAERFGALPIHLGAAACALHSREDS